MKEKDFFKSIMDQLYEGVYFVDRERRITYWNCEAENLTGYPASEVIGSHCYDDILKHMDDEGTRLCKENCPLAMTLKDGRRREAEVYLHHREGHRVPVALRTAPIYGPEGEIVGAVETFIDNSSKLSLMERVRELQDQALLDHLTGIPNRRAAEANLALRLEEKRRYGWGVGVIFLDIDGFKDINDTHGHDIGDKVIGMVAKTLMGGMRPFDFLARWGGDEFVIIAPNVGQKEIRQMAERLRILVEGSAMLANGKIIDTSVSMGAAVAKTGDTVETLIKKADQLMYESKNRGGNQVVA